MSGWTIFYIATMAATIGGAVLFLWNELRYKHRIKIREITSQGRSFVIEDKAMEFTDENNAAYWKLKKERDKIKKLMPVPPANVIDITKRGKKFVEAFRFPTGEYRFLKVNSENEDEPYDALTTNQRMSLVYNIKKANTRGSFDWKRDLPMFVMSGAIVVLIAVFLIFAPDIITTYTKGATQISDSLISYEKVRHDNMAEEMKQWEKISEGIQTIHNVQEEQGNRMNELEQMNP